MNDKFFPAADTSADLPIDQPLAAEEKALKGIFSAHKNPFLIFENYCDNPKCDCNTIILTFVETSDRMKPLPRAMEFDGILSIKDWQLEALNNGNASVEKIDAILKEFKEDLTPSIKNRFRQRYQAVKSLGKKAHEFNMSNEEILSGAMRGYWEVFGKTETFFSFEFEHENQKYLIADQYCLNAECDCQTLSLSFATVDDESGVAEDVFGIFLDLQLHYKIEFSKYPRKKLRQIVDSWLKSEPDLQEDIAYRYRKMKEVGSITLERNRQAQMVKKTNIGRNDPCPCGSGKKYKKCCGQE